MAKSTSTVRAHRLDAGARVAAARTSGGRPGGGADRRGGSLRGDRTRSVTATTTRSSSRRCQTRVFKWPRRDVPGRVGATAAGHGRGWRASLGVTGGDIEEAARWLCAPDRSRRLRLAVMRALRACPVDEALTFGRAVDGVEQRSKRLDLPIRY